MVPTTSAAATNEPGRVLAGRPGGPAMSPLEAPRDEGTVVRLRRDDGASLRLFCHGPRDAPGPAILILDGIGCAGWAFERSHLRSPGRQNLDERLEAVLRELARVEAALQVPVNPYR
mgnify:CR=1 FL=1